MQNMAETIKNRLTELISLAESKSKKKSASRAYNLYMSTISIAVQLYGPKSVQVDELKAEKVRVAESKWSEDSKFEVLIQELKGILNSFMDDLDSGLVEKIENEARGDIYSDFIVLAKECFENESKDPAIVLACAALEDSLKKYAVSHGVEAEDDDMSMVINKLKSNSLIKKPEAKILQSYVTLRNKAFHAQWDKIGETEISSLIAFVERFIIVNFSGN